MYWSSLGHGVYLHNWQPSTFNSGGTDAGKIQITASSGEMDFYLFGGPTFADIAGQYTALTGRPAMLPKWALGYHQGGAGNDPTLNWASGVASQMRQNQLPLDAVYYDDWDASYFTPAAVGSLKDQYHIQITAGLGMPYSAAGSDLWNALAQLSPKGMLCDAEGTPLQYCANGFENPVTVSDGTDTASCVNDLDADSFWDGGATPQWACIDLEDEYDLQRVVLKNYYGILGQRAYTYSIEGSLDGQSWFPVAEKTDGAVSTALGILMPSMSRPGSSGPPLPGTIPPREATPISATSGPTGRSGKTSPWKNP